MKEQEIEKQKNYKNSIRIAICIACTALMLSVVAIMFLYNIGYKNVAYTIYVGSVDKDEGRVILSIEEAKEKITKIFENEGEGFTLYTADGGYLNGDVYDKSPSYVIYTSVSTKKRLDKIMEKLGKELNTTGVFAHKSPSISYYTDLE